VCLIQTVIYITRLDFALERVMCFGYLVPVLVRKEKLMGEVDHATYIFGSSASICTIDILSQHHRKLLYGSKRECGVEQDVESGSQR